MIDLTNITQEYKQGSVSSKVLDNLSFNIESGEKIGIVGPSGSGKTTLLNIIALLEQPTYGDINIYGQNCKLLNSEEKVIFRRKKIGFVFQNSQLLEDFTVEENIALPLILDGQSYKKSLSYANEMLRELDLLKRRRFKPGLLSGGEQQRVAIARALIKNPKILLADEPTGSLDEQNSGNVVEFITNLSNRNKTTTILATHNLNLIRQLDKSYEIRGGKLVQFKL
ncbi:MAG: ABC transporter ATP-binding protein [Alphaproteobacteria bacterium]